MTEHRRAQGVEIRAETADDGHHYVTLQAIKPGVVDDYGSLWKASAFDESLAERLPVLAWSHDWSEPLGRAVGYEPSRTGPRIRFRFSDFEAVPTAKRAYAQLQDGTLTDCSVGFFCPPGGRRDPTDEERSKFPGIREVIDKAGLDEVSLVLRGAVPGAKVLSLRNKSGRQFRMPDGKMVDAEFVIDLARQVSAGDLTHAEAQAAIELASGEPFTSGAEEGADGTGAQEQVAPAPEVPVAAMLDAEALAASALT